MFDFNHNRVKYEYCELIDSDLEKLYQKAKHLKSIGYENAGNGAFFNSDNNQYRITMRKINSLPRKYKNYESKNEKNDENKKTITIFFFGFICVILLIQSLTLTIDLNEREKEIQRILNKPRHYQSLCNEAKDNNSRGDKTC